MRQTVLGFDYGSRKIGVAVGGVFVALGLEVAVGRGGVSLGSGLEDS